MDFSGHNVPNVGENFSDFPKRLPDDCVEYSLFIIDAKVKNNRDRLARLEAVRKELNKLISDLLKDYIWQRENFTLNLKTEDGAYDTKPLLL